MITRIVTLRHTIETYASFPLPQTLIDDLTVQERGLSISLWFNAQALPPGPTLATLAEFGHMWLQLSPSGKIKLCDAEGGSDAVNQDKCATSTTIASTGIWYNGFLFCGHELH
jgi:hypothetical protein